MRRREQTALLFLALCGAWVGFHLGAFAVQNVSFRMNSADLGISSLSPSRSVSAVVHSSIPENSETPSSLITEYLNTHAHIPVLVLCHDRPDELRATLSSLLGVRGSSPELVYVSQDGLDEEVKRVATRLNLRIEQRTENLRKQHFGGGQLIAEHYGRSLATAFDDAFPDAPALIVLEDDMRLSPDFLDYFQHVGPMVEHDPTLWCASAWNDNGFEGLITDPYALRRTNLFPGLGWLVTRKEYDATLRQDWPNDQWDWFVRRKFQLKERECIFPEVPRAFHAGRVGTFMNQQTQAMYFDRIRHNTDDNFMWKRGQDALKNLELARYNARLSDLVSKGAHVSNPQIFTQLLRSEPVVILWYNADPDPNQENRVRPLTNYFGIWHQIMRGSHDSAHELRFKGTTLILINVHIPRARVASQWFTSYARRTILFSLKPEDIPAFDPDDFIRKVQ